MIERKQIEEVVGLISAAFDPDAIYLFGSYAHSNADEDSDLDLAVIMHTTLPSFKRSIPIREILRSNDRRWNFAMDILVITPEEWSLCKSIPNSIYSEISSTGKLFYESSRSKHLVA